MNPEEKIEKLLEVAFSQIGEEISDLEEEIDAVNKTL